ncbi:hypothetical protein NCHU2750_02410 [Neorhizobium sp. NCHU2750]|nr:hypothetical protein NCHU2750_02410 [Neorhizobium sp. NCHU2750]
MFPAFSYVLAKAFPVYYWPKCDTWIAIGEISAAGDGKCECIS